MSDKIKVLYIAGLGRSGSTLLNRVLGQIALCGAYGELRYLWQNGLNRNAVCGCGKNFRDCEFWTQVMAATFDSAVAEQRAAQLSEQVDRTRFVPQLLGLGQTTTYRQRFQKYTDILQKLYTNIASISGKSIIIDTSKFSSTALILSRIPNIELHVLYLVRDSRAVGFSWQRHKMLPVSDGEQRPMTRMSSLRAGLEWTFRDFTSAILRFYAASFRHVRYEDFIQNPQEVAAGILQQIGHSDADLTFISPNSVTINKPTHTVAGNPNRMDYGEIPLRMDDEWRSKMAPRDFALITLLTLPGLLRYGYPLRRGDRKQG